LGEHVAVILRHQLTPELAEGVQRAQRVLFVDASAQDPPGKLRCRRLGPRGCEASAFSHHLTPAALLALTQTLFGRCPEAFSLSVGGADFSSSEALSPQVRSILPRLLRSIRRRLHPPLRPFVTPCQNNRIVEKSFLKRDNPGHLLPDHDHGNVDLYRGANRIDHPFQGLLQNLFAKKNQRIHGLVLGRRGNPPLHGKVIEKLGNLFSPPLRSSRDAIRWCST
jgi:Ni,Fe-hydrogenase maturation factor